jgi:two-component system capsular synthesis sensor histidine kinase RcsC
MTFISEVKHSETDAATIRRFTLPRVLVVDDDDCLLQTVQQMVETLGFKADAANGGFAAMQCLSRARYDLMVTDLQMPDMDGYALSSWLNNKFKGTKVIVMTGMAPGDVAGYMHTGIVDGWLFKPFSLNKLGSLLGEMLSTDSLRRFARHGGQPGTMADDGQPSTPRPASMREAR